MKLGHAGPGRWRPDGGQAHIPALGQLGSALTSGRGWGEPPSRPGPEAGLGSRGEVGDGHAGTRLPQGSPSDPGLPGPAPRNLPGGAEAQTPSGAPLGLLTPGVLGRRRALTPAVLKRVQFGLLETHTQYRAESRTLHGVGQRAGLRRGLRGGVSPTPPCSVTQFPFPEEGDALRATPPCVPFCP